jgi:CubicO group peptidase (beta-lactamase class C family)
VYALAYGRRERLVETLLKIPLESAAGERVCYSCLGYLVLGVVLERVFGAPLDRLFKQRVAQPLGLSGEVGFRPDSECIAVAAGASTSVIEEGLTAAAGFDPRLVPTRRHGDPDDGNARFLAGVAANAGLFGTASAVLRIARLFLDGGEVLDPELVAIARRDHTAGLQQARGLGWQIASSPGCSAGPWLSRAAFGHTGFTGTSVWVDPSRPLAIALLTNRLHPGARLVDLHPLRRALHRLVADAVDVAGARS